MSVSAGVYLDVSQQGLAVSPMKILSDSNWTDALTMISNEARSLGKAVAVHTHFNHPREITWVTELAAQKLFDRGIVVRNQTVLLKGVNDDLGTMQTLIRMLADNNIQPVRHLCFIQ
jgi:lysine 2,3-aminomutase